MKALPFQPIVFESPIDPCQEDNSAFNDCALYLLTDPVQVQFKRLQSDNPVNCNLIDQSVIFEMITDGGFELGLLAWPDLAGFPDDWLDDSGKAQHIPGNTTPISQAMIGNGVTVKFLVTFDIIGRTAGSFQPVVFSGASPGSGTSRTVDGTYTEVITAPSFSNLYFYGYPSSDFDGRIDNISVTPMIDENTCWSFSNWQYTLNSLIHIPGNTDPLALTMSLTVGVHYKVVVRCIEPTAGHALIKCGSDIISALHENVVNYYFVATDSAFTIVPTDDYNGSIQSIDIYTLDKFADEQIYITNVDESIAVNLGNKVTYEREWATLAFQPAEEGIELVEGCYKIKYAETTGHSFINISNCLNLKAAADCTKLFQGWCNGEGFDFLFSEGFRLSQRLPLILVNSSYPNLDDQYNGSDGVFSRQFTAFGKRKKALLDHANEITHDCTALTVKCNNLKLDQDEVYCDDKEYNVKWDEDGSSRFAPSSFELRFKKSVLYNRNTGSVPYQYLLRVLTDGTNGPSGTKWDNNFSWKVIDSFGLVDGQIMTFRMDSIVINGIELLTKPEYYNISKSSGVIYPDLIIATGINGNDNGPQGTNFVQNVDEWINSFIANQEVQFYDSMSVIEYIKGTTFSVKIGVKHMQSFTTYSMNEYTHEFRQVIYPSVNHLYTA